MHPIKLTNVKKTKLSFTMDISGIAEDSSSTANFVIVANEMSFSFPCERIDESWECTIPPLPFLERGTYDCFVEVMVDSFYFKPYMTECLVSGSPLLNVSEATTTTPTPKVEVAAKPMIVEEVEVPIPIIEQPKKTAFTDIIKQQVAAEERKRKTEKLNRELQAIAHSGVVK